MPLPCLTGSPQNPEVDVLHRLTVSNSHSSTITDASAASSGSGVSVALAPTRGAGATQTGVTTAQSGEASATGAAVSNNVRNADTAAVLIHGASDAPVTVASNASTSIQDTGAAGATSGAAWAVAAGAAAAASNVATPVTAGAAPTSAALSATGIQVQNAYENSTATTVDVPGGAAGTGPINVTSAQGMAYTTGGWASTISGAAASASAPATAAGATQAASGAAQADGVVAQNNVQTNANVAVNVGGQNFAPITVIINSITQIFNWGAGSAKSGDAVSNGSTTGATTAGATTTGGTAASGSAQATGAQVGNSVALGSSAKVHVAGDNLTTRLTHRPLDLAADIDGNNYAPIYIRINFTTNIDNIGYAGASSGNVAAGQPSASGTSSSSASGVAPTTNSGSSGGTTSSGSSATTSSVARSGDAVAISNSVDVAAVSSQLANANGGNSVTTAGMAEVLRNLPQGTWNPFVQQTLPDTATPTVVAGMNSSSGNSLAIGLHTSILSTNAQIAACQDAGVTCTAANSDSTSIKMSDLPYNPTTNPDGSARGSGSNQPFGPGGTNAVSEFSGVNATPTPKTTGGSSHTPDDDSVSSWWWTPHRALLRHQRCCDRAPPQRV